MKWHLMEFKKQFTKTSREQQHKSNTFDIGLLCRCTCEAPQQLLQFENIAINVSLTVNNTQAAPRGLIINSINSRECGGGCSVSAVKCPFMQQTSERYGTDLASE